MKFLFVRAVPVLAGAALVAGCAALPPDMRMGAAPTTRIVVAGAPFNAAERDFVTKVAAKSMYEIEVSRLAADKASNAEVKSLAQHIRTDHEKSTAELKSAAGTANVSVAPRLDAEKQA